MLLLKSDKLLLKPREAPTLLEDTSERSTAINNSISANKEPKLPPTVAEPSQHRNIAGHRATKCWSEVRKLLELKKDSAAEGY